MIEVVNISKTKDFGQKKGDVYIGRSFGPWPVSPWQNVFKITATQSRERVLQLYEQSLNMKLESGELRIESLQGVVRLGCWCKPEACHGDILKRKVEEYYTQLFKVRERIRLLEEAYIAGQDVVIQQLEGKITIDTKAIPWVIDILKEHK